MAASTPDLDPDLFYRVTDNGTGDEYDVRGSSYRSDDHTLVKDREPSTTARPHKSRTDKAGHPAPRQSTATAGSES